MKKLMPFIFATILIVMFSFSVWGAGLTADDVKFLKDKCLIDQADIDVISKLNAKVQDELLSIIAKRDCELLKTFKNSRNFARQLNKIVPPYPESINLPKVSQPWSVKYLTEKELDHYLDLSRIPPKWE